MTTDVSTLNPNLNRMDAAADSWKNYEPKPLSFGQKWAKKAHWLLTDIGVNYFVNVTISVGLTYAFEKTLGAKYNAWLDKTLQNIGNPMAKAVAKFVTKFATKSQILLMGGHTLIPFMKYFHDNKHAETAAIANKLDGIAGIIGIGDDASKQNREDYARLKQLMSEKPQQVSENDARILSQYGIGQDFKFIEEKKPWKDVLLSRFKGMMFSLATNATIGATEGATGNEALGKPGAYNKYWAGPIGNTLGRAFAKIPGFTKVFPDSTLFAREYANDLILTAASTTGFMMGMKNSDKNGPDHNELCAENSKYWSDRVVRNTPTEIFAAPKQSAAEQILAQARPQDMAGRIEEGRTADQEALTTVR